MCVNVGHPAPSPAHMRTHTPTHTPILLLHICNDHPAWQVDWHATRTVQTYTNALVFRLHRHWLVTGAHTVAGP